MKFYDAYPEVLESTKLWKLDDNDPEFLAVARHAFSYDPETGWVTWVRRIGRSRSPLGSRIGDVNKQGYRIVSFLRRTILEHRFVWFLVHGKWPEGVVDHLNGVRDDNRLCNLRDVTVRENMWNAKRRVAASGVRGVDARPGGSYRSSISVEGSNIYLGTFETEAEASAVFEAARMLVRGGFKVREGV